MMDDGNWTSKGSRSPRSRVLHDDDKRSTDSRNAGGQESNPLIKITIVTKLSSSGTKR